MSKFILAIGLSLSLAACAGPKQLGGGTSITVTEAAALPAPDGQPTDAAERAYLVGGRDKLLVDVVGIDELKDREFETDSTGEISLPWAGRINASGMTLGELENAIATRLRAAHVRDPKVSVNVIEIRSRVVTVDGSVTHPGLFPVTEDMTLMRAVAEAQGVTEFAKLSDVVIFREVNGRKMVALYNLGAIRRGMYDDPPIFAGDVVVVGESAGRRLFSNLVQAGALITAPIIAFLNNSKL